MPALTPSRPEAPDVQQVLAHTLVWIRGSWEHRESLMPEPYTGLAGHSYGALHAGILATKIPTAGVVSLSGVWNAWDPGGPYGPLPIFQIALPRLFTWGTDQLHVPLEVRRSTVRQQSGTTWHCRSIEPCSPRHSISTISTTRSCPAGKQRARAGTWGGPATDDLVTMFFAKYLPPELWPNLPGLIPGNLVPPPLQLTPAAGVLRRRALGGTEAVPRGHALPGRDRPRSRRPTGSCRTY